MNWTSSTSMPSQGPQERLSSGSIRLSANIPPTLTSPPVPAPLTRRLPPQHSNPNSPTKNSQLKTSSTTRSTPLYGLRKARLLNLQNQDKVAKKVDMTTFFGQDTRSRKRAFDRGVPWGFHGRDYQPPMV